MSQRLKECVTGGSTERRPEEADAVLHIKAWPTGISPRIWRHLVVPMSVTLRELHGVIQVATGWEGIHLHQLWLGATHYGSSELPGPRSK